MIIKSYFKIFKARPPVLQTTNICHRGNRLIEGVAAADGAVVLVVLVADGVVVDLWTGWHHHVQRCNRNLFKRRRIKERERERNVFVNR